eukprot:TRINITY_DN8590_c0_g1_i1.p1 TRINITY_DN8590_c0_g1~~TRINITY_DN8590_c0_g1_i1.p1  ORF type:complete len:114 (-),score=16.47 TRINITY_DN8590_c0_g1_i1:15-356(-)
MQNLVGTMTSVQCLHIHNRESEVAWLFDETSHQYPDARFLVLTGPPGVGISTVVRQVFNLHYDKSNLKIFEIHASKRPWGSIQELQDDLFEIFCFRIPNWVELLEGTFKVYKP